MKQFIKNPIVAKYMAEKYPELAPQEPDMTIENPVQPPQPAQPNPFATPEVDMAGDREAMKQAYADAMILEGAQQIGSAIGRVEHKPGRMMDMMTGQAKADLDLKKEERGLKRQKTQDDITLADRDRNMTRQDEADERTRDEFGRGKQKFEQEKTKFDKEMQNMTDEENPDSQSNRVFQQTMSKFGPEFQSMTISDYKRYGGNILKLKQDAQQLSAQNEERRLRRQEYDLNKQESQKRWDMMFQDKVQTREAVKEAKVEEKTEKKKTTLREVEDRRQNIDYNLKELERMVADKGTFETLGSHNQELDRRVDEIATDMAKLMDPDSVARPSEVDLVKKNLIQSGFQNSNSTALDVIRKFKADVGKRADMAYKIRGIDKNSIMPQTPATSSGKIKVSNGKETFEVDAEDLADAEADGFKRMGR